MECPHLVLIEKWRPRERKGIIQSPRVPESKLKSSYADRSMDHPLPRPSFCRLRQTVTGCVCTDSSLLFQPPHELPNCCLLAALSHRETRLQGVLSSLGHVQHTVGLQAAVPRPSGAVRGLMEQFVLSESRAPAAVPCK